MSLATQLEPAELEAIAAAEAAAQALRLAVQAYKKAGYGNVVTNPLYSALSQVEYSVGEVRAS